MKRVRFLTRERPCCGAIEGNNVVETQLKQSTKTSEMLFNIPRVISFITRDRLNLAVQEKR